MDKRYFCVNVTLSEDSGFDVNVNGSVSDAVVGLCFALATLVEAAKNEGVSDQEMEAAIMLKYHEALEVIRDNKDALQVNIEEEE